MLHRSVGSALAAISHSYQEAAMIPASTHTARPLVRPNSLPSRATCATDVIDPAQLDLTVLMRRCLAESDRFYRGRTHDTRFAYELFRRAIVEQNDVAWEYIYTHY